jgi:large subunit ribosomal protein L19
MSAKIENFVKTQLKTNLPDIRPGDTVKIHQKIAAASSGNKKEKERIQIFEGQIIAKKHGRGIASTVTVRKVISGVGVEKVFPVHSPIIDKIELVKRGKPRRSKLYYLRKAKGRKTRLKREETVTEE